MNSIINILILASEITKGMKSIGPKCLLKLSPDISILDYQILQAKQYYKHANISVLTGFESDRVKKHIETNHKNVNVIYDKSYASSNQTNAVLTAVENLKNIDNLLIISSGILLRQCPKLKANNASTIFYLDQPKDNFNIGSLKVDDHYLFYGLPNTWSECVFLNSLAIDTLSSFSKMVFSQLYLFETINKLMENHVAFENKTISKKEIFKLVSHKDIAKAKRFSLS